MDEPTSDDDGAGPDDDRLVLSPSLRVASDASTEAPVTDDPEALRRLIVEILRAELQGPIGDRMSWNVKEMVRREVKRALADRD